MNSSKQDNHSIELLYDLVLAMYRKPHVRVIETILV